MKIDLYRVYKPNCTIGSAYIVDDFNRTQMSFKTLELPWRDNERNISCIPEGSYRVIKHNSPKFKQSFWLQDVPDRSEILIHIANFTSDLRGCIAPGERHVDMNRDGVLDVTSSRLTLEKMYKLLPNEFQINIKWTPDLLRDYLIRPYSLVAHVILQHYKGNETGKQII